MHNIKLLRKNFEDFKSKLKHRNSNISIDDILSLDEKNRSIIQEKETLEMEKKNISKSKNENLFSKSKDISLKIDDLTKKQKIIKNELDSLLSSVPNLPLNDVPEGDERANKEISKFGEIRKFNFKVKSH